VIGICAALERAQWSVWDQPAVLLPVNYIGAIQRAGGLAIMLPPDELSTEAPEQLLALLDGLILAGGADIDPASYGAEADPQTIGAVPERDRFEISLARAAIGCDLPLLGICRGMQLINVACGGTLVQHLPDRLGHGEHRRISGSFDGSEHDVELHENTLVRAAAGERMHSSRSHHHQGVDSLGAGLVVSGVSTMDGLAEAIEVPGKRFVLGVQWHPEADPDSAIIAALVAAAARAAPVGVRE